MVLAFLAGESGESIWSGESGESGESGRARVAGSPLLSTALMFSHDGIVGTRETRLPDGFGALDAADFERPSRLAALAAGPCRAVLDFEAIEPIAFRMEKTGNESLKSGFARVLCRTMREGEEDSYSFQRYTELVSIQRPEVAAKDDGEQDKKLKADLKLQIDLVRSYADLRPERIPEIQTQMSDILSFFSALDFLDADRTKWTLELLALAVRFAIAVEMRVKHALNHPRPLLFSPYIQPIIHTPNHGSLPSGHATEAFIVATVLTHLLAGEIPAFGERVTQAVKDSSQPYRLAARIAINRTIAGVHYPVDSAAGAVLGITLGEYLVARSTREEKTAVRMFDGTKYGGRDFHLGLLPTILEEAGYGTTPLYRPKTDPDDGEPDNAKTNLEWVWRMAKREMQSRWRS
jgi:hypothetical protein